MVYLIAADLMVERGLLRTRAGEVGIWYRHQLPVSDSRKGRTTTVGAIASGCVHADCIRDEVAHLAYFARFAGVERAALVEDGRKVGDIVELLRACAGSDDCR